MIFKSFTEKIKHTGNKWAQKIANSFSEQPITNDFWDSLEETLITADVGVEYSLELIDRLKEICIKKTISNSLQLKTEFFRLIESNIKSIPLVGEPVRTDKQPSVILLIGVNGSGKTTTAGKLAQQLKQEGKKVILAAADTFRAAAIEQLKAWGKSTNTRVVAHETSANPAAVVFDAISAAKAGNYDVVIVDTAGRLHTKSNLMDELGKIFNVIRKETGGNPSEVLIVLDSVMGQNAYLQAEQFSKIVPISGVILTKFDNTAKGGIVLSITEKLKLPVRYIGVGEAVEDLLLFDLKSFLEAMLDE